MERKIDKYAQLELRDIHEASYEDEIYLIDIVRLIWKWKTVILTGAMICALVAATISFFLPEVYRVRMVIRPGVIRIENNGQHVYFDSVKNIKALIDTDTFNDQLLKGIVQSGDNIQTNVVFNTIIPQESDTLMVTYDTSDIDQGVQILNSMSQLLLEKYSDMVKHYQNEYAMQINTHKIEINKIKANKQSYETNAKNIELRIKELESEIGIINNNTKNLNGELIKFLSKNVNNNSILSDLLYSNAIQQNLQLINIYKNEINDYKLQREGELLKAKESENEISKILATIGNLESKRKNVQSIQMLQSPSSSPFPLKPNRMKNIILATTAGLFLMTISVFILEFISNNKDRIQKKDEFKGSEINRN